VRRRGGPGPAGVCPRLAAQCIHTLLIMGPLLRGPFRWGLSAAGLAVIVLAAAAPADAIVGGDAAPPGRWPWMVALLNSSVSDAGLGAK